MTWDADAMFSGDWFARFGLLSAMLVLVVASLSAPARRRWRRGAGFAAGVVLGAAALLGLMGIAVRLLAGPERLAQVVARFPDLPALVASPLPNVVRPTPQPEPPLRPTARPQVLDGRVTWVRDGDTIEVGQVPIRFARVDCAERGTPEGDAATRAMRDLASGQPVRCTLIGRRSYDREIGTCHLMDGRDLGAVLVSRGMCAWR